MEYIVAANMRDEIVRATKIYARRQRTWLAKAPIEWLTGTP